MPSTVCFENFYSKTFGTLIWDIGKSTFLENTKKCYYSYQDSFKIPFFELCWKQCRQGNYCFYIFFFIAKMPLHSLNSKKCIRFLNLLLWIILLRIFYLFTLPKLYLWKQKLMETVFKRQLQYISSEIQVYLQLELSYYPVDS